MRYFVLTQDERVTDSPYPNDFHQKIDVRNATANKAGNLPERTLVTIRPDRHTVFPDMLCSPVMLVTRETKEVINAFDPYLAYRQIVYLDQENELMQLYFMPALDEIDCLSDSAEYTNACRGAFSKVALQKAPIRDKSLFQVKNGTRKLVIVRLDLAESLLARNCSGFALTEAAIE
jgi:hypothetical protein